MTDSPTQPDDLDDSARPHRRMQVQVLPLHVERQLWVADQTPDPHLAPAQLDAVGTIAVAVNSVGTQSLLGHGDVLDADHPTQPAATGV